MAAAGWESATRPCSLSGGDYPAAATFRPMTTQDDRELAAKARLDAYVKKIVDAAPPLTPDQRSRLAVLLASPHAGPSSR